MKVLSFKASDDLAFLIENEARRRGITKSELIRQAVVRFIHDNGEKRRVIATRKIKIYL